MRTAQVCLPKQQLIEVYTSTADYRPCSDFMDMLRRLISCRIIILLLLSTKYNHSRLIITRSESSNLHFKLGNASYLWNKWKQTLQIRYVGEEAWSRLHDHFLNWGSPHISGTDKTRYFNFSTLVDRMQLLLLLVCVSLTIIGCS